MARVTLEAWVCASCGKTPPEVTPYSQTRNNVAYLRPTCRQCDNAGRCRYKRLPNSPEVDARWAQMRRDARRSPSPATRARHIIIDSTKADRRKGRETVLTEAFVVDQITKPCHYCADTEAQMTLDRIDNALGHTEDNVVPSCFRCNVARGAMPYAAWMLLTPGMRQAREQGLFGEWDGRTAGNTRKPVHPLAGIILTQSAS